MQFWTAPCCGKPANEPDLSVQRKSLVEAVHTELSAGEENGSVAYRPPSWFQQIRWLGIAEVERWFCRLVPFTYSHIHEVRRESSSTQNLWHETQITSGYARMHESAANVDGKSTGKPAASDEAVDGYVLT